MQNKTFVKKERNDNIFGKKTKINKNINIDDEKEFPNLCQNISISSINTSTILNISSDDYKSKIINENKSPIFENKLIKKGWVQITFVSKNNNNRSDGDTSEYSYNDTDYGEKDYGETEYNGSECNGSKYNGSEYNEYDYNKSANKIIRGMIYNWKKYREEYIDLYGYDNYLYNYGNINFNKYEYDDSDEEYEEDEEDFEYYSD